MNLTDLETFLEVAKTGSFTAAASDLGVPKSTVSRRVARLEGALGVELLVRKARTFTLSLDGRQLAERCAPALDEIAAAERSLEEARGEPRGRLRITAPGDVGASGPFVEMLASYQERWPEVELVLELTQRRIDLIEEGFDVAFRAHMGQLPDSATLTARTLFRDAPRMYAAPSYVERAGTPRSPKALARHRCLTLHAANLGGAWPLRRGESGPFESFDLGVTVSSNSFDVVAAMTVRGAGIALMPVVLARRQVETGGLVPILSRWTGPESTTSLVWPITRYPSPRVRTFIDHAVECFSDCSGCQGGAKG